MVMALAVAAHADLPAGAKVDTGTFDVEIRGIRVGVLGFSAARDARRYSSSARFETRGIVGVLARLRFDGSVRGQISGRAMRPLEYRSDFDNGDGVSVIEMRFNGDTPVVERDEPRGPLQPWDIDPADQRGVVDPMTAALKVLLDTPRSEACKVNLQVFDGRRRMQVTLGNPRQDGDTLVCSGEMRRIAGYEPGRMEEQTRFPFEAVYAGHPDEADLLQLRRLSASSRFGNARLARR